MMMNPDIKIEKATVTEMTEMMMTTMMMMTTKMAN